MRIEKLDYRMKIQIKDQIVKDELKEDIHLIVNKQEAEIISAALNIASSGVLQNVLILYAKKLANQIDDFFEKERQK